MLEINFRELNSEKVICEDDKRVITIIKESILPMQESYSIVDSNDKKIGNIKRSRYSFGLFNLPKVDISINNSEIIMKKNIFEFKDYYEIKGNDFNIIGDWEGTQFNICKDEEVLALVNVEREKLDRTYKIDIIDKFNEEYILAIIFSVDLIV